MRAHTLGWCILILATALNFLFFESRWADPPSGPWPLLSSERALVSVAVGFGFAMAVAISLRSILARHFAAGSAVLLLSGAWALLLYGVPAFVDFFAPEWAFALGGTAAALACCLVPQSEPRRAEPGLWSSFVLFTAAALNFFLLLGPASSYLPSIVQDSMSFSETRRTFFYGSVHSDMSPVSMGLRAVINSLLGAPGINATALSSMLYVSVGIALGALATQLAFGRVWAWLVLAIACTDKWLFNAGVSSAVLGQPVLSVGLVMFLCSWALFRLPGSLSWREALLLGAFNLFGIVYSLYSYSAARMTWLVGSALAALILILRRAVWFNWDGLRKALTAVLPAVFAVLFIWSAFFGRDTERFTGQLLISPKPDFRVKDVNSYSDRLIPYHDPDVPIWWGSARAEHHNIVLHWRRTPAEVIEKLDWFFDEIGKAFLPPTYLVFLAVLGLVVGIAVARRDQRKFTGVVAILTLVSFATYVLAQDRGAYRRAVATDLLFAVGVVALLASTARGRASTALAVGVGVAFVGLKVPLELNTQFDKSLWGYVCPICQPQFQIHQLVGSEAFKSVAKRPMTVLSDGGNLSPTYEKCITQAVNSFEFKQLSPGSRVIKLGEEKLADLFARMAPGDVVVAGCAKMMPNDPPLSDPDRAAACAGAPTLGRLVGTVPPKDEVFLIWWALLEKS